MTDPADQFRARFRELFDALKRAGGTQESLAEAAGVRQSQISLWLRGTLPSAEKLPGLARALGVTIDELYGASSLPADVAALARDLATLDEDKRRPLMAGFTVAVEYQLSLQRSSPATPKRQKQS